jgi:hypothetical protein
MRGRYGGKPLGTATCVGVGIWFISIGILLGLDAFAPNRVPIEYIMLGFIPGFLLVVGCFVSDRNSEKKE